MRSVHFRVVAPAEFQAHHWFEVRPVDIGTRVRHMIDGEVFGEYEAIWRDKVEPRHDLILEALLDNIEAAVGPLTLAALRFSSIGRGRISRYDGVRSLVLLGTVSRSAPAWTICSAGATTVAPPPVSHSRGKLVVTIDG